MLEDHVSTVYIGSSSLVTKGCQKYIVKVAMTFRISSLSWIRQRKSYGLESAFYVKIA